MKTIKAGGNQPINNSDTQNKEQDIPDKHKWGVVRRLRNGATKIKFFLKNHFPKRIWSKPQENRKGPKF